MENKEEMCDYSDTTGQRKIISAFTTPVIFRRNTGVNDAHMKVQY